MDWFDGHLDLAYLAQAGRNMDADPAELHEKSGPVAVTFSTLTTGRVRRAAATVFIQPKSKNASPADHVAEGAWCYATSEEAFAASARQLEQYRQWHTAGRLCLLDRPGVGSANLSVSKNHTQPLEVMILLEGAAGVRNIDDLRLFHEQGVRILALSWVAGTPWAGGDHSGGDITPSGLQLIAEADRLELVHDVSHLSEAAFWTLLGCAQRPKIASHSNCRSLLPDSPYPERHLSDRQIQALSDAGGMIGINLYSQFLAINRPAKLADVVQHIRHILDLTGRMELIGLGSDMDGGFSAAELPAEIRRPADLVRLAEALSAAGLTDSQIEQFAHGNWERFFHNAGLM